MKILWIKSDFLYPPNTGGRIRSYNLLKQLARDHEVYYLCLSDEIPSREAAAHLKGFCAGVEYIHFRPAKKFTPGFYIDLFKNLFSPYPYVINKYDNPEIKAKISYYIQAEGIEIILCDFLEMAINCLENDSFPKAIFQHNVETEIWRRHYQVSRNPLKKLYLYLQYKKYVKYESMACGKFDDVLVVSEADGKLLEKDYGVRHTTVIPTAVDIDFFKPGNDESDADNLVFVGSMDWLPNQDAVDFFINDIFPKIKARRPEVKFYIVGRRPPEKIVNLAESDKSVVVTGTVDDVRPYVDRAGVYVIPLRIGGGTRIKIFEAMAQAKAIVSTTIGAEGLPLTDGKDIIIKDTPEEFAAAVCELMENRILAKKIGGNSYKLVTENYSWEKVSGHFSEALEIIVNQRRGRKPVGGIAGES